MIAWVKSEWTIAWGTHRKWGVMVLTFLSTAVDQALVSGDVRHWAQLVIVGLAALGVRQVKNAE